jgi:hypothetical protein
MVGVYIMFERQRLVQRVPTANTPIRHHRRIQAYT